MNIQNVSTITIDNLSYNQDANLLFSVNGVKSKGIKVTNTDTSKAKNKVEFNSGAVSQSLELK